MGVYLDEKPVPKVSFFGWWHPIRLAKYGTGPKAGIPDSYLLPAIP